MKKVKRMVPKRSLFGSRALYFMGRQGLVMTPQPEQQQGSALDASLPSWAIASRRPFPAYFAPPLRDNVQHHVPLYAHHLHASYNGQQVRSENALRAYVQAQQAQGAHEYAARRLVQDSAQRPFNLG